jgi:hypothetical protein
MDSNTRGLGVRVQRRVVGALMDARMRIFGRWSKVDQSTLWVGGITLTEQVMMRRSDTLYRSGLIILMIERLCRKLFMKDDESGWEVAMSWLQANYINRCPLIRS